MSTFGQKSDSCLTSLLAGFNGCYYGSNDDNNDGSSAKHKHRATTLDCIAKIANTLIVVPPSLCSI